MLAFMAGALAEATISFAVQKLGDSAIETYQQYSEITDDIKSIKGDFSMMKAFLKDAERRRETSEAFNEWVKQVKSAAFMIEDFMDECLYAEQGFEAGGSSSSDMVQKFNWKVVPTIKLIKNMAATISKRGHVYGLHLMQSSSLDEGESSRAIQHRPVYSSPFEEVDIVGFDEDVRKLMDWLLSEEETPWSVMSIVGMGGSGKTTLAKKVYSLAQRQSYFDYHFCVNVSQYSPSQLCDFLEDIHEGLHYSSKGSQKFESPVPLKRRRTDLQQQHNLRTLLDNLRTLLDEKRYVLFLDDINNIRFWEALEGRLPGKGRGKIIFTSRVDITSSLVNGNCLVHMLNPLPFELAWNLFCRNAFRDCIPPGSCPTYLNDLGEDIVRCCSGLPLAIVLMGRLMSNIDGSPNKWKDVKDHFDQEILYNPGLQNLKGVLQASYNHLPSQLKYCFLYCCLFPKHHRIKRKEITRLWVAQRFVEQRRGKLLEDVADDYFVQLIERNFLQPIISEFTGEITACNIHEIMHDFAISMFPEEFGIPSKDPCNECEQKRFLALQNNEIQCKRQHSKARSFLIFSDLYVRSFMDELHNHKFLMVLCLDGSPIMELPSKLGDLFHLKYLSLKGTQIEVLPDSLGKLYNLETLDVRDTRIQSIPESLGNLRKLRHLLLNKMKVYGTNRLVTMPNSMLENLSLLQTLSGVEAYDDILIGLLHLVQLRKLYIRLNNESFLNRGFFRQMHVTDKDILCNRDLFSALFAFMQNIESLRFLKVESLGQNGKFDELKLGTSFRLAANLEKLALGGVIRQLPPWFGNLKSLRVLVLINSMLINDPLSDLATLPNLVSLKLIHAYTGELMGCGPGGFPRLRHLHMASLVEFEEWTAIAEGAMPCIKFLTIVECKKLRMLPEGFERLKTLQSLEVIEMPEEFIARLLQEDKSKIQHIPKATLHGSTGMDVEPLTVDDMAGPSGA